MSPIGRSRLFSALPRRFLLVEFGKLFRDKWPVAEENDPLSGRNAVLGGSASGDVGRQTHLGAPLDPVFERLRKRNDIPALRRRLRREQPDPTLRAAGGWTGCHFGGRKDVHPE